MTLNKKPTGTSSSVPVGLTWAGIAGLITIIVGSLIIAHLINMEYVSEDKIGYAVMILLLAASYICSITAWKKIKRRKLLMCLSAGIVLYIILLSITALFFGGQYSAVGETALLVLCGSLLPVISIFTKKSKHPYRIARKAHC